MKMTKYKCENTDCPYCIHWMCTIEGDPMEECDDFGACFDSWEEWEEL